MVYKKYHNIKKLKYNKLAEHTISIIFNMHIAYVHNEH